MGIFLSLFLFLGSSSASDNLNNGYYVLAGASNAKEITGPGPKGCKKVTVNTLASGTKSVFVPTKLAGEWTSFVNSPPQNVSVETCLPTSCPIGQYLNGTACTSCSGPPTNASFTGSGNPITSNNCPWVCSVGYTKTGNSCVALPSSCPIGQYLSGTACVPCSTLPMNASFTGSGNPVTSNNCPWVCKNNYSKSGSNCVPNTRVVNCSAKITNSDWNTVNKITQTWNGSSWQPSNASTYNLAGSSKKCRYKCGFGFIENGGACIAPAPTYFSGTGCGSCPIGTQVLGSNPMGPMKACKLKSGMSAGYSMNAFGFGQNCGKTNKFKGSSGTTEGALCDSGGIPIRWFMGKNFCETCVGGCW